MDLSPGAPPPGPPGCRRASTTPVAHHHHPRAPGPSQMLPLVTPARSCNSLGLSWGGCAPWPGRSAVGRSSCRVPGTCLPSAGCVLPAGPQMTRKRRPRPRLVCVGTQTPEGLDFSSCASRALERGLSSCAEKEDHGIWSYHFMGNRWGNSGGLSFHGFQNHCRW